jgi:hypothetical protein
MMSRIREDIKFLIKQSLGYLVVEVNFPLKLSGSGFLD